MRAALLEQASAGLRAGASQTEQFGADSTRDWDGLFRSLGGPAPVAARGRLERAARPWRPTAGQMRQVAAVVEAYASVTRLLEEQADARLGIAAFVLRPATAAALDALCALEIRRVCAPVESDPAVFFDARADAPLAAIHAEAIAELITHAPEDVVAEIAGDPDVAVLEAGEGHLVAVVYPGGAAALDRLADQGTVPASVTTIVPGVGSNATQQWPHVVDHARSVAKATGGPAVAWIGYTAPDSIPEATRVGPARAGARELERFQATVARRWPGAQRVVVGHSYGSVVAGAARGCADDVVLVGSPGTSRRNAGDIGGSRVWSATNRDDPIALSTGPDAGAFGPAPSSPGFGATSLPGADGRPGGHSDYWDDPAFYAGLAAITRGRGGTGAD